MADSLITCTGVQENTDTHQTWSWIDAMLVYVLWFIVALAQPAPCLVTSRPLRKIFLAAPSLHPPCSP